MELKHDFTQTGLITQSSCCVLLFLGISHRRTVNILARLILFKQFHSDIRIGDFAFSFWFLDNKECVGPLVGGLTVVEWNSARWIKQMGVWECQCKKSNRHGSYVFLTNWQPNRKSNSADSQLFWVVLYGTPLIWGIFAFSCILTMKVSWLFIVVIAIAMNAANVYGFSQCDKDAKRRWTTNLVTQSALGSLGSGATGLMSKAVSSSIARSLFSSRRWWCYRNIHETRQKEKENFNTTYLVLLWIKRL